jgi:hypothetical protein
MKPSTLPLNFPKPVKLPSRRFSDGGVTGFRKFGGGKVDGFIIRRGCLSRLFPIKIEQIYN